MCRSGDGEVYDKIASIRKIISEFDVVEIEIVVQRFNAVIIEHT